MLKKEEPKPISPLAAELKKETSPIPATSKEEKKVEVAFSSFSFTFLQTIHVMLNRCLLQHLYKAGPLNLYLEQVCACALCNCHN